MRGQWRGTGCDVIQCMSLKGSYGSDGWRLRVMHDLCYNYMVDAVVQNSCDSS